MHRALFGCLLLTGCVTGDTTEVPLRALDAQLSLDPAGTTNYIALVQGDPDRLPCPTLPPGTTATLDGVPASEMRLGDSEDPHGEVHCIPPLAIWSSPPASTGVSTFVIDDSDTAWTFQIEHPFTERVFELPSSTLRAGDVVDIQLTPASGSLTNAHVVAYSGATEYFDLDEASGVTREGFDVHFTVPAVPTAKATLSIYGDVELAVARCDAPLGCAVSGQVVTTRSVTLAP